MTAPQIVHLASQHRPTDPRVFQKECRTLARAGYRVAYVLPHERDEVVEGVQLLGVPKPANGRERLTKTLLQVYRRALSLPRDAVYHFHDAELILYMLALKAQGRRVIYDAHEDTPLQIMYQHWIPRLLRRPIGEAYRLFEAIGGRVFDHVIAAEPAIAARYPASNVTLIRNYPIRDELVQHEAPPYDERPAHIAYVGGITEVRGAREMVEAVGRLPASLEARLRLGGSFHPASLHGELQQLAGWQRTDYLGWLQRPQVADELARARLGVILLHPVERYFGCYSTKLYEYMAASLPVICSDFPHLREIVEPSRCGLLVDPLDVGAVAEAVQWLLEHPTEAEAMGRRGRQAVLEHYNWEQEAPRLLGIYERMLPGVSAVYPTS